MERIVFSWDARKAASNLKKHGVSFDEARTAFYDEKARLIDDPDHSDDEERFILLGMSYKPRLLIVCHAYRAGSEIRLISARKATKTESSYYGSQS
ncbi:MAG: BrnT family toxin [Chloracidobacterium sp.]|nr:BrnT family toxin [Chloracidobacterium sp.]